MKSRIFPALIAGAALCLAGSRASADQVRADWNHQIDFSQYHTYSWGKIQVADPSNAARIQDALRQDLKKKGWQEVPSGGQVSICITGRVRSERQLETYYNGLGGGWGKGWGWDGWGWGGSGPGGFGESTTTTTRKVPQDHIVIDMFDARNKQLIWRGISQGEIHKNPEKDVEMIHHDISTLLSSFPPQQR